MRMPVNTPPENKRTSFAQPVLLSAMFMLTLGLKSADIEARPLADIAPSYQLAQTKSVNKAQAAKIAQGKFGGKVLSVSEQDKNGRRAFKVKLLQNSGRVKIVSVNQDGKLH